MRLFLALDPGDVCRQRLAGVVAAVRASSNGIRWVRENQLHVTLLFLGDVADGERVEAVIAAMRAVAARHEPFTARVTGSGVFPDWRRARVVWLGVQDADRLTSLGEDVGRACASVGFPPEHPFRAHVTIGRIPRPLSPAARDALKTALASLSESHPFAVSRVVLMRSEISTSGSSYSEVASFALGGA